MKHRNRMRAFTLVELLVVIAIIGILVALLLPAIQAAREAARRSQCQNNLKQIGIAIHMHHDTKRQFPMGRDGRHQRSVSWAYLILPYMEEKAIYDAFDETKEVFDPANSRAMRTPIEVYACPTRRRAAADRNFDNDDAVPTVLGVAVLGDYAGNAGHDSRTDEDGGRVDLTEAGPLITEYAMSERRIVDGLSKTFVVGERHIPPVPTTVAANMEDFQVGDTCFLAGDTLHTVLRGSEDGLAQGPDDRPLDSSGAEDYPDERFGSLHSGVVQFVFLDGHVAALSTDIDVNTLMALSTVGGSETVQE
jgi:prepilin-type N-terminal cleavage/methylation domain-containing protein/prepilin-type processing-associated H-X9-DG protein